MMLLSSNAYVIIIFCIVFIIDVQTIHAITTRKNKNILSILKSGNRLRANAQPKSGDVLTHAGPGRMAQPSEWKGESWMCRSCVDVVQTWRDTFPCAGANDPMRQARQMTDTQGCSFSSRCDMFKDERLGICLDMKRAFREDRFHSQLIHKEIRAKTSFYDICEKLSRCEPQTSEQGSKCSKAINEFDCADDPFCKDRTECAPRCHVCYWVVKTWPVFMEECYRGVFNGEAPPKNSKGLNSQGKRRRRRRLQQKQSRSMNSKDHRGLKPGAGSPPWEPAPQYAENPVILQDYCYQLWDEVENSAIDRYLISVKSEMGATDWHAQTVCQCMKICPYDELEAIDLLSYCSADELKDPAMLEAIKRSMFPDLSKSSALPSKHPRNPTKDMEEQKSIKNFWEHGW
jgi:hypothetical protein